MIKYVNGALDLATWLPPQRTVTNAEGEQVVEKLPSTPSQRWVDTAGNVRFLPLYCSAAEPQMNDPYRLSIEADKRKHGWLPLARCPKGDHESYHHLKVLPNELQEGPICTRGVDGYPIGRPSPCRCMEAIIAVRRSKNAEEMRKLEERHKKAEMRDRELREQQVAASNAQTERLTELLERMAEPKAKAK